MDMFLLILAPDKPPTLLGQHYLARDEVGWMQHLQPSHTTPPASPHGRIPAFGGLQLRRAPALEGWRSSFKSLGLIPASIEIYIQLHSSSTSKRLRWFGSASKPECRKVFTEEEKWIRKQLCEGPGLYPPGFTLGHLCLLLWLISLVLREAAH